jgi:hypothetical protein
MQDRYAGDVGDFGKFGMLRNLANTGLKVGVNWYRTYIPEEHGNGDGKYVGYLNNEAFKGCDDELLESLRTIAAGKRSIAALKSANLLPGAKYYSKILRPGSDNSFSRDIWFKNSLKVLAGSDIVFCDPDNGLLVKSVSPGSSRSNKYVTENELVSYYLADKSVVFYNHRCREKEPVYLQRFAPLQQKDELAGSKWKGLKFARGSVRDFIFILRPSHVTKVETAIKKMMQGNWCKHFSLLGF